MAAPAPVCTMYCGVQPPDLGGDTPGRLPSSRGAPGPPWLPRACPQLDQHRDSKEPHAQNHRYDRPVPATPRRVSAVRRAGALWYIFRSTCHAQRSSPERPPGPSETPRALRAISARGSTAATDPPTTRAPWRPSPNRSLEPAERRCRCSAGTAVAARDVPLSDRLPAHGWLQPRGGPVRSDRAASPSRATATASAASVMQWSSGIANAHPRAGHNFGSLPARTGFVGAAGRRWRELVLRRLWIIAVWA